MVMLLCALWWVAGIASAVLATGLRALTETPEPGEEATYRGIRAITVGMVVLLVLILLVTLILC